MGYKEVFQAFSNKCWSSTYTNCYCAPKCSIGLVEKDKKEYEECAEIDHEIVNTFISSLIGSKCITDSEKIPIYNLIFKRTIPTNSGAIKAIRDDQLAKSCLFETKVVSISNAILDQWLHCIDEEVDLVHFCLSRAPMDKDSLKILISYSNNNEDDKPNSKCQLLIHAVTQNILKNWSMIDNSIFNYVCCKLDVYWNLFNAITNKGFALTNEQIILIMIHCEVKTIENIIQNTRPLLINDYLRAIICPSEFQHVLDLVSDRFGCICYSSEDIGNKIKLIQKYGYVVTREDWVFAISNKIVIDGVNFVADEDVFKICNEKDFFPELKWNSEELKKKCEFRIFLRSNPGISFVRTWITKNNYIPDEDAIAYFCRYQPSGPILDLFVKSGGQVTTKVLRQTALGYSTRDFVRKVAKYCKEE